MSFDPFGQVMDDTSGDEPVIWRPGRASGSSFLGVRHVVSCLVGVPAQGST